MVRIPKYILAIGIIIAFVCVGFAAAAIPQACEGCTPETYPGSDTCPIACRIAFPADAEWTYPDVMNVTANEPETDDEAADIYTSPLSGNVIDVINGAMTNPYMSPLSGATTDAPAMP